MGAGLFAISYEGRSQIDLLDLATEKRIPLSESINADSLESFRLFEQGYLMVEKKSGEFWVRDLKGNHSEVFSGRLIKLFFDSYSSKIPSPFFILEEKNTFYLVDLPRQQKIELPAKFKEVFSSSSSLRVFDGEKDHLILSIRSFIEPKGEYIVDIQLDSLKPAKIKALNFTASRRSFGDFIKVVEEGFESQILFETTDSLFLYEKGNLKLLHIKDGQNYFQRLTENARYWKFSSYKNGSSNYFIYDLLTQSKIFSSKNNFKLKAIQGSNRVQFVVFEEDDRKQKATLLDAKGKILQRLSSTNFQEGFAEPVCYSMSDSIILMRSGLLIGLDALPLKNLNYSADFYEIYQKGGQLGIIMGREIEENIFTEYLLIDFDGNRHIVKEEGHHFTVDKKIGPYIFLRSSKDNSYTKIVNLTNGSISPGFISEKLMFQTKKNELKSLGLQYSYDLTEEIVSFINLSHADNYIIADYYAATKLNLDKQLKQKVSPYYNGDGIQSVALQERGFIAKVFTDIFFEYHLNLLMHYDLIYID